MIGDLTGNRRVDNLDITAMERMVAGLPFATSHSDAQLRYVADVNGDGRINALDISAIEYLVYEQMQ